MMSRNSFANSVGRAINRDRHEIIIHRTGKIDSGEGYDKIVQETLPVQYVRLYPKKATHYQVNDVTGNNHVDGHYGLLGDIDIDIQASPELKDVIESRLGNFLVKAVHPYTFGGRIVGYQADLERVTRDVDPYDD